ncbi:hypothetical protein EGW08_016189 [Elysia chlorotica]|uniref:Hexosyltransferase n=1 Tax=Elysia chlorotica TaxID=188477 RepID=A0A3S1B4T0_ELYCH|nr:hypothetical protein EGW08_016189 [Elysia chlorotica]
MRPVSDLPATHTQKINASGCNIEYLVQCVIIKQELDYDTFTQTMRQWGVKLHPALFVYPLSNVWNISVSVEELRRRSNKHPFTVKAPFKKQLSNPYFKPDHEVVESYRNKVLLEPKARCGNSHSVHVIVPSSPGDERRRNAIRDTWGSVSQNGTWPGKALSLSVKLTFIVGIQDKGDNHLRSKPTLTKSMQFTNESQFDDIVQFDMIDSYSNLTRKILLALKWVVHSCKSVQYIIKADQDIFINVPILLSFLKHHGKDNSIYGFMYEGGYVARRGRWGTPKEAYPLDYYPVYASGNAYVVSRTAAEKLVRLSTHFPYVPIEDAFITGILASVAAIDRIHMNAFTHWQLPKQPPCDFINDKKFAGNGMTESDMRNVWQKHLEVENRGRSICK